MKQYTVDAFTDRVFSGNPAAVCVMEAWPEDALMLAIAKENNLSETAFAVREPDGWYRLRWFTPHDEIDLCGHATLATSYVILRFYEPEADCVRYRTRGGELTVRRAGALLEMEFPVFPLRPVPVTEAMASALGVRPSAALMGRDLLCVLDSEQAVRTLAPDQEKLRGLDGLLVHVTARGAEADCVSRSFAPKHGIAEDPVCGSGHCHIAPYWAEALGKGELTAYQASARGGTLHCRMAGEKLFLSGSAVLFAESELFVG